MVEPELEVEPETWAFGLFYVFLIAFLVMKKGLFYGFMIFGDEKRF